MIEKKLSLVIGLLAPVLSFLFYVQASEMPDYVKLACIGIIAAVSCFAIYNARSLDSLGYKIAIFGLSIATLIFCVFTLVILWAFSKWN